MNLIDRIQELRKLEGRRRAIIIRQKETGKPNHALLERLEIERDMIEIVCMLLDEYEMQAKQIANLEEHERQTHEILGNILGKDTSLEAGARRAMEQIATLKAALIRERMMRAKEVEAWATSQLARELPEIFKEDKQ